MKLYSGPISLFTAKVRIALAEKGIPVERVEVGWTRERRYEPHHPDVVALNPKRQVRDPDRPGLLSQRAKGKGERSRAPGPSSHVATKHSKRSWPGASTFARPSAWPTSATS